MCGIVGYIGDGSASEILLEGLKRLEYRGYDSSGLAVCSANTPQIMLRRCVGKISNLERALKEHPLAGSIGVAHTRWATHGIPSEENAHPHHDCSAKIVVVHNGIIENYAKIKEALTKKGHQFSSQTDTEVIAHLIEEEWKKAEKKSQSVPLQAEKFQETVRRALKQLEGSYALGILSADFPEFIIAARKDCPLVLGLGKGKNFLASDVTALLPYTRRAIFLGQQEMAVLKKDTAQVFTLAGKESKKSAVEIDWDPIQAEKAGYPHFMLKEMMEQPTAITDTIRGRLLSSGNGLELDLPFSNAFLRNLDRILLVACGTSYHAALVARFWFEQLAAIPTDTEIASEFRYRENFLNKKSLAVFISQSGETADTLAALRIAKDKGAQTLAICNVLGASIAREAHATFYTHCGPEIGVASTKAFVGQLTALFMLSLQFGKLRRKIAKTDFRKCINQLLKLPGWAQTALSIPIESVAKKFYNKNHFLYLGRNLNYPIALEGALKLKEISYIHAEGYPAGEMKHGPIALIDEELPVVAIATSSSVYEKICSNIQEAKARGGKIVALATAGDKQIQKLAEEVLFLPQVPELLSPIINVIPLQLLAYHIAVLRGCDVDQPRNLAKSVTVE